MHNYLLSGGVFGARWLSWFDTPGSSKWGHCSLKNKVWNAAKCNIQHELLWAVLQSLACVYLSFSPVLIIERVELFVLNHSTDFTNQWRKSKKRCRVIYYLKCNVFYCHTFKTNALNDSLFSHSIYFGSAGYCEHIYYTVCHLMWYYCFCWFLHDVYLTCEP